MLRFDIRAQAPDVVYVALHGHITGTGWARLLEERLAHHLQDQGIREIRLDLRDVRTLDLEGARVLALYQESGRGGKPIRILGAAGQVRRKLAVTGTLHPWPEEDGHVAQRGRTRGAA